MRELRAVDKPKFVQLYSTDWKLSVENIENYINSGFGFIYEYIDDISPELAGTKELPQYITDKYNYAMTHEDVYVVVTADLLLKDVLKHRSGARVAFSSNGVDNAFFQHFDENYSFEPEFQKILDLGKPIVCYYGALAKWFDYELVKKIAAVMNDVQKISQPDFSLNLLAREVGSNTAYVSWVINNIYHHNFKAFLNEYRIREACRRMDDHEHYGHITIQALIRNLGYSSYSNFVAAFKKVNGMTPSQYQRLSVEADEDK